MQLFGFSKNKKRLQERKEQLAPESFLSSKTDGISEAERESMPHSDDRTTETDLITCALKMAPYIKGLLGEDIGLGISDLKTYPYYGSGKVKLTVREGDLVGEGSIAYQTMQNGTRTVAKIGKEVYGLPYVGTAYPLKDPHSGNIVGSILTVTPVERQENLNILAGQMENQVETIAIATTNLSATSEELAATAQNLNNNARRIGEEIKKTDGIVTLIQAITEQTHLLGLNAAIEAARVGDAGRGFNVVAGEIRKLSQDAQRSVKETMQTLRNMQQSVLELINSIGQISAGSQQQAASAQEINSTVDELIAVAENLKKQADELVDLSI